MSTGARVVIISALEREIAGLVRGWSAGTIEGSNARFWQHGEVAALAVGMGWDRASEGTKVAIETFCPELITSVGYSGSLTSKLPVGRVFVPAQVVGFRNDLAYSTGTGEGVLVTAGGVAGTSEKAEMAARYGAQAVDMEAAAVAEVAKAAGVRFVALRVISDAVGDEMDFVGAFVTPKGFRTGAFLAHVAVRPRLWSALAKLARNTQKASEALTEALLEFASGPEKFLARYSPQGHPSTGVAR